MTGYGRAETVETEYSVSVEIKSVNNRFLDFQCKAPRDLLHLEQVLRKELGAFVTRGSVTCHVHYELHGGAGSESALSLNEPLFNAYAAIARRMAASLEAGNAHGAAHLNLADLLKIPDMVLQGATPSLETAGAAQGPHSGVAAEVAEARILPVFRRACEALVTMREREGQDLVKDFDKRVRAFYPSLDQVATLLPLRQKEYVARIHDRVSELLQGQTVAEDRLMTEIGIMAEKLDVQEEMVRLRAHLDHFLEVIAEHAAPGKKLGFLQQEMLREINTLSNKSQYYDIQQICVNWKEEIEILREQIANVE
jgi:uncharacterized protein (TIGR00255 family)